MITSKLRSMSTITPDEFLSYDEWREHLKREHNVVVSGKYLAKSIENRVRMDEVELIRQEYNIEEKPSGGTAKPRILFGVLKTVLNF